MFVHAMEGSWLQHPFWKKRFVLDSEHDLQRLLDSDIPGIIIDDERGAVPEPKADPTPAAPVAAAPRPKPRAAAGRLSEEDFAKPKASIDFLSETPCSVAEETERARAVVGKAKRKVMKLFGEARLGRAIEAAEVAPLVDEISASIARNPSALINVARLKNKDEYTYMHSVAVCALMINLARTIELNEIQVKELGLAGMLHDLGKMAVPDPVLNKPGKLTDEEFAVVREHPQRGYDLLVQSADAPAIAAEVVLHHHEKYDGTGYPHGLKGEEISLHARMGAICDVYDAITSNRPYKEGWAPAESIARMLEWEGHFDPKLLDAFVRSIGIYPVGTLVRLRSNRLGLVVAENKREPTHPKVKAFYAIFERTVIRPELVTIGNSLRDDAILKRELPEHWNLGDWSKLQKELMGR
jgi:HD-GYP domain-containing protein (c-di-GMP phosphodiesterase class II)